MIASRRNIIKSSLSDIPNATDRFYEFRSLGGNCEFGFVQRRAACEASSLLRFSYTPIEALIHALSTDFDELGTPGDLYLDVTPHNAYYCVSHRYGIWSALNLFVGDEDPAVLLEKSYARIAHLKRKMLEELASGKKIYVRKLVFGETQDQFDRLVEAIRRHGPSTIVQAKEDPDGDEPTWTHRPARRSSSGVIEGAVRRFSPMDRAWDIDLEPWIWLCDDAYALHHGVTVESLYPTPWMPQGAFSSRLRLNRYQERENRISSYMRAIPPAFFDPVKVYLFQTWVWIPAEFTGERIFALCGQQHMQFQDADLDTRESWQRVWRAGRFRHDGDTTAPVGLGMIGNPPDTFWSYGAEFYEGVFPKFVETPTFRPSRLRLLAKR